MPHSQILMNYGFTFSISCDVCCVCVCVLVSLVTVTKSLCFFGLTKLILRTHPCWLAGCCGETKAQLATECKTVFSDNVLLKGLCVRTNSCRIFEFCCDGY